MHTALQRISLSWQIAQNVTAAGAAPRALASHPAESPVDAPVQILLPPSAGASLMAQDASKVGTLPMLACGHARLSSCDPWHTQHLTRAVNCDDRLLLVLCGMRCHWLSTACVLVVRSWLPCLLLHNPGGTPHPCLQNGPMFFKLVTAAGSTTHAGLLEFSAAEGFVALPLKVCQ